MKRISPRGAAATAAAPAVDLKTRKLAERISGAQADRVAAIRRWYERRYGSVLPLATAGEQGDGYAAHCAFAHRGMDH